MNLFSRQSAVHSMREHVDAYTYTYFVVDGGSGIAYTSDTNRNPLNCVAYAFVGKNVQRTNVSNENWKFGSFRIEILYNLVKRKRSYQVSHNQRKMPTIVRHHFFPRPLFCSIHSISFFISFIS